jgi:hypothetical protein
MTSELKDEYDTDENDALDGKNYEPLFWDIETLGLDPMPAPAWVDDQPPVVIGIAFGWFDEGWRSKTDWDYVGINTYFAGLQDVDGDTGKWQLFGQEHELLEDALGYDGDIGLAVDEIQRRGDEVFVTGWNTRNFDHPFLGARCGRHRLTMRPFGDSFKRLDMMRPAASDYGNSHAVSEDDYLDYLGMPNDDDFTGEDMLEEFEKGNLDAVRSHAMSDVTQMMEIFFSKRKIMYDHFFRHYDIDAEPAFGDTITF